VGTSSARAELRAPVNAPNRVPWRRVLGDVSGLSRLTLENGFGEARSQIEAAWNRRDRLPIWTQCEGADPTVRCFGPRLKPTAGSSCQRFDVTACDNPHDFLEVSGKDRVLFTRRLPENGREHALLRPCRVGRRVNGDPQDVGQLSSRPGG